MSFEISEKETVKFGDFSDTNMYLVYDTKSDIEITHSSGVKMYVLNLISLIYCGFPVSLVTL